MRYRQPGVAFYYTSIICIINAPDASTDREARGAGLEIFLPYFGFAELLDLFLRVLLVQCCARGSAVQGLGQPPCSPASCLTNQFHIDERSVVD